MKRNWLQFVPHDFDLRILKKSAKWEEYLDNPKGKLSGVHVDVNRKHPFSSNQKIKGGFKENVICAECRMISSTSQHCMGLRIPQGSKDMIDVV